MTTIWFFIGALAGAGIGSFVGTVIANLWVRGWRPGPNLFYFGDD